MKPILTIGIPTYNRKKHVLAQVRRLLPQLCDAVKLIVVDNNSPFDISSEFTDEEKRLFEIKINKVNIGGDANIANIIYNCETEWVWALGDDDYVKNNAIEIVLDYINRYPDEIFINFSGLINAESHDFESFVELFKYRLVYGFSFWISSCIYNRSKLKDSIQFYYKYQSSQIGQIIYILKHLENKDDKCLFTKDMLIDLHGVIRQETGVFSWNSADFVINSSIIYYIFRDKKKNLKANMFRAKSSEDFTLIYNLNLPFHKKYKYYKCIFSNVGILNFIRYNYITLLHRWAKSILPQKYYEKLVSRAGKIAENKW